MQTCDHCGQPILPTDTWVEHTRLGVTIHGRCVVPAATAALLGKVASRGNTD